LAVAQENGLNFLNRLQPLGLLILRLALGAIMIAHGWQKIADHMHMITGMMHQLGLPTFMAYLVVSAEFGGGILVLVGFLTRLAAFAIFIDMLVAILKVHLPHGLFSSNGGFEFPLACAAIAFSLIWSGAGPIAVDWLWGSKGR
jgi:putative oxidoreductase